MTLVVAVVVTTSGIILTRALVPTNSPGLSFTGSNTVAAGGILHVHGQGFIPNGNIKLTIDAGRNANLGGLSQMFIAGEYQPQPAADVNVKVSASGTFDTDVPVPSTLPPGMYTIHATEDQNSLDARLSFTVVITKGLQKQAKLNVSPQSLDFGQVPANQQALQSLSIADLGELPLTWQADVGGASWLSLDTSSGTVQPGNIPQTIHVSVNTTGLTAGSYTSTVNIISNGGNTTVSTTLIVAGVTPTPTPTPLPTPTPTPSPTPTPTPRPTATTIKILGGVNLDSYCQSIGDSSASLDGNTAYDWRCVTPGGQHVGLSMTAACRWQYNDPQAEDRMADYFNSSSWQCWG